MTDPVDQIRRRRAAMRTVGERVVRRRRIAPQVYPKAIELSYARFGVDLVRLARDLTRRELVPRLAGWTARLDAWRTDSPSAARALIASLRQRSAGSEERLSERIREFGRRTERYQGSQLQKQIRSAMSVEVPLRDASIGPKLADWTTENVALIKSLPSETFDRIERIVLAGLNDGRRWESIAEDLEQRFDVSESRAALIARDQVGKFYGAVNRARQTELGVTRYRWRTSGDERVRPDHVEREGKLFSWDDAPEDGHPGQPISCRCTAEPDFSAILDDLD